MRIGPYTIDNPLALAPMAGVTDRPFRQLCRQLGAGYLVTEMLGCNPALRSSRKTRQRSNFAGEPGPVAVQIAGSEPRWLAEAAQYNVARGAQIIDINMGCPAKKVCRKAAGSALMSDTRLVKSILTAVVDGVDVPVTLKMRTGPDPQTRNAPLIARIAEDCGIAALAVHGRTRADRFNGSAEYDTIAQVCAEVSIPVFANGDIGGPREAQRVLRLTQADGLMIGRMAQGNPWIFKEIRHFLDTQTYLNPPTMAERFEVLTQHLAALHAEYGESLGVRVARKHLGWYLQAHPERESNDFNSLRQQLMRTDVTARQFDLVSQMFQPVMQAAA